MIPVWLFVMGIMVGTVGALLGLGGGIFLVPLLTLIFHFPIRVAIGTSLVGIIATSAGVTAVAPRGHGADVSLALRLEVATTAGAIAGSYLTGVISTRVLEILFAIVVFLTASYLYYKSRKKTDLTKREQLFRQDYVPRNWPGGMSMAALAGTRYLSATRCFHPV